MAFFNSPAISLKEILEKHKKWLNGEESGERACLRNADLSNAILCGADLSYADLRGADLNNADLREANFYNANLRYAYFCNADLSNADLRYVDFRDAYFRRANLYGANLDSANLNGANFSRANLRQVNFDDADLRGAYLNGAIIEDDVLNSIWPICCPESGSFIGWKKSKDKIIKLEICEDALRSSAFGRKCRCSKAKVISIENMDGSVSNLAEIPSGYDKNFIYKVGEIVEVDNFDTDRKNECAAGIHFFITRKEAVEY